MALYTMFAAVTLHCIDWHPVQKDYGSLITDIPICVVCLLINLYSTFLEPLKHDIIVLN